MGGGNEGRKNGIESLSLRTENYPSHLLQKFIFSNSHKYGFWDAEEDEESEHVELSLGLSLGGRFGVDKNSKKLTRSSSIASTITIVRDEEALNPPVVASPALMRTSSLPTETEEEWRKRKELQSLRRMEAKRRRSEKQRCKEVAGGCFEESRPEIEGLTTVNFWERKEMSAAEGLIERHHNWVAATGKGALLGGIVDVVRKGKSGFLGGHGGGERGGRPSPGSTESQAGSSSGMLESESKPPLEAGSSRHVEARVRGSTWTEREEGEEEGKEPAEEMPCVFTVGEGPGGRRVEGILYKYGNGEEVRIMCVCHGAFLSPAEFVKHAGGGHVSHPLRHIVVNPTSSSFL